MGQQIQTVVLAQCTSKKRRESCPAQYLYEESAYFRKQRAYAKTADKWFIQSAKYGLVRPDEVIEPYDEHARDLVDPEKWAEQIARDLNAEVEVGATVKLLGGTAYTEPLVPFLERFGYDVHTPLQGQRIGERMATLDEMVQKTKQATL